VTGLAWPGHVAYWGIFFLSLLVTLYMVLLDLRYIRLMYVREEKDLFEDTLGSEEFRQALLKRSRGVPPAHDSPRDGDGH
jgi:hypothetical protein